MKLFMVVLPGVGQLPGPSGIRPGGPLILLGIMELCRAISSVVIFVTLLSWFAAKELFRSLTLRAEEGLAVCGVGHIFSGRQRASPVCECDPGLR